MVRRSVLFTPGDRPEMLQKAPRSGADVVVFDLEDAVSPARKDEAREAVREVLAADDFDPDCEVCVRINATSDRIEDDLEGLFAGRTSLRLDSLMLPKASGAADVHDLVSALESNGVFLPVIPLVESAAGVLAAPEIAAVPATDALAFGAEDLSADVGATVSKDGSELEYARQRVVLAAAAHDCPAIDTLVTAFEDEKRLREDVRRSVRLGYDGKLAIHPAQIDPINEAFTPDDEELEWARRVLEAKREADAEGRGVFEVDGEMIDAPLVAQAERLLERAEATDR
ncbi:HpcH/HpaI aldolase/citrate lyase family protein [Natronobacterium gregoryi]|uniref:Citrate (Pro-3S)-lyase n=2 Tax=Natronobacterium gregoryi TaxID=44930 RepID=L0AD99_NATGS|nr:CoA ester lyase [Natronobacterium gregoryi]AFZ71826.1 citrate lyase beta subunit [Natronobacterium gregoryi SP2]ELY73000.1 citrate (pro-3S)-lyase [Natronobacterium gregoryi SP2]PLK19141.1 CoA ester lyase [Natronobacterium gregoryi SP2]SFJ60547.1 citrate lyase subunit beta / citryl-CoA lyase [Natronobacterium gregoryi]